MRIFALSLICVMVWTMIAICYVACNVVERSTDFQGYQSTPLMPEDFK